MFAHAEGVITIGALVPPVEPLAAEGADGVGEDPDDGRKKRKKKWRKKKGNKRKLRGDALAGDNLGGPDARNLNADQAGGEEQLLGNEIEAGFDSVFPKVRRCLMLVDDDGPVRGKLVFGMRISGEGKVTRVNLKGPAAITKTESGGCMRKAVKGIRFRSFNGPDMLVHFPLTLD